MTDAKTAENERWDAYSNLGEGEFMEILHDVTDDMHTLLVAKRRSYGPKNLSEFGDAGVLIRTNDKIKRLVHMWKTGETSTAVEESDIDAWRDIAGYALLVLASHEAHQHRIDEQERETKGVARAYPKKLSPDTPAYDDREYWITEERPADKHKETETDRSGGNHDR